MLTEYHFRFRRGSVTENAGRTVSNLTHQALNEATLSIGVFLDFAKAFDSLDRKIFLSQLDF